METVKATLEITVEGSPAAGTLTEAGGKRRPFVGWIELAAAIEDLRHSDGQDPEGATHEAVS